MNQKFELEITNKMIGQWGLSRTLIRGLNKTIKEGYDRGSKKASNKYYTQLRANIRDGASRFGYAPLKPRYLKRKAKKTGRTGLFQFYNVYYRSIIQSKSGDSYLVHIKRGVRNPKTGGRITISKIAAILEMGDDSRGIPERPLWKDTYNQIGGRKFIRKTIEAAIAYQFLKKYNVTLKRNAI